MTLQQVLDSNLNKTQKAFKLYEMGYTRRDIATWITNGNYGFAHNIWKKWNDQLPAVQPVVSLPFEFTFNRTFGIELEIYGPTRQRLIAEFRAQGLTLSDETYNHNTRNHWKIVSDASIQGTNGNEIVSPVLCGHDGIEQLKKACIALTKAGAMTNKSCGFHVHFGASDFTLDNFKSLALSHMELEGAFDSMMPISRRGNTNTYCKGLASGFRTKNDAIAKINAAGSISAFVDVFAGRYHKLNFKSYNRQGTVEFRHHSGTTTFSKIKNWVLICGRMVEYAKQNGFTNNINSFLNDSLTDYLQDRAVDLAA